MNSNRLAKILRAASMLLLISVTSPASGKTIDHTVPVNVMGAKKIFRIKVVTPDSTSSRSTLAVVSFPGSGAGMPVKKAETDASKGYVGVAVEYFSYDPFGELPYTITHIPLDGIAELIGWLKSTGLAKKVVIDGRSRGGELVLLFASRYAHLVDGVVAEVPSAYVWGDRANGVQSKLIPWDLQSPFSKTELASWTDHGVEIPFLPFDGLLQESAGEVERSGLPLFLIADAFSKRISKFESTTIGEAARIKVEDITVPVLVTGGRYDGLWPSGDALARVEVTRKKPTARTPTKNDVYLLLDAGHDWTSTDATMEFPSGIYDQYVSKSTCEQPIASRYSTHEAEIRELCRTSKPEDLEKGVYFAAKEVGFNYLGGLVDHPSALSKFTTARETFLESISRRP